MRATRNNRRILKAVQKAWDGAEAALNKALAAVQALSLRLRDRQGHSAALLLGQVYRDLKDGNTQDAYNALQGVADGGLGPLPDGLVLPPEFLECVSLAARLLLTAWEAASMVPVATNER